MPYVGSFLYAEFSRKRIKLTNYCRGPPYRQDGTKLGKQHVRKLLKAVQRDCLEGIKTPEQKVNAFVSARCCYVCLPFRRTY